MTAGAAVALAFNSLLLPECGYPDARVHGHYNSVSPTGRIPLHKSLAPLDSMTQPRYNTRYHACRWRPLLIQVELTNL